MKKNYKPVLFFAVFAALLLLWAPWMGVQEIHDKVFNEKASIDGTIDKETGELICDYNVMWLPFGRYVASCEGGYFITFYGKIIP